ncbi:MAG: helix-turn-helix transcriptional regulator, partial [Aeriscardovia sp.]|nr:helix-turn-helix transcriptional regulator [Aeriscardovia sp.]
GKIVGKSASSIMGYEKGLREIPEDVLEKFEEWMASAEKKKQMTGEQLKSLRCAHGLSQAALGKIIGKHRSTVIDYEKGVRKVPEDVVNKLEGYFGISSTPTSAGDASPGADCASDLVKDNPVAPEDLE